MFALNSTLTIVVVGILSSLFVTGMGLSLWGKKWDPKGNHCYVTGGSSGLGLDLAILLVTKGADVSIVARNQERLKEAMKQLESVRQSPDQKIHAYSHALNTGEGAEAALEEASQAYGGKCPDALFLCAGAAQPGFFVEQDEASLKYGMDQSYWVQALSALAGAKRMARSNTPGKIVFISSVLGYMSTIGWCSYAPGKHALRGLAETLRQELLLYNSTVHIFFPATILSPGFDEENKTKPAITAKMEEGGGGNTPKECAETLLAGVQRGDFHISIGFVSNLFRCSTRGSTPTNNFVLDSIIGFIAAIALPFWRRDVDGMVDKHRVEHQGYLRERGLLS